MLNNELEKIYQEQIELNGEDRIAFVFKDEKMNNYIIGYIPKEEELYNTNNLFDNYKKNNIIDLRILLNLIQEQNEIIINFILTPNKIINKKYDNYFNKSFFTLVKECLLTNENQEQSKKIKNIIEELIKNNINSSQEQEIVETLTKTELKSLEFIINYFSNKPEGDIKVNQITNQCGISTVVFRTLFYKLKEYKIAEIDSRGVKGTHIKFKDINKIKSLIDK